MSNINELQIKELLVAPYTKQALQQLKKLMYFRYDEENQVIYDRLRIKRYLRVLIQRNTKFDLTNMPYQQYLETSYWFLIRMLVRARDKNRCSICKTESQLQVHHLTYEHRGEEFDHLKDLTTLCADCHYSIHREHKRYDKNTWKEMQAEEGKECPSCHVAQGYKQFIWHQKTRNICRKCIRAGRSKRELTKS